MSLETGTRIPDLVPTNPVGATDFVQQGDDHIRLIKLCLQGSFPAIGSGQVTATAEEISELAGSGVTNADLVKLHALTATAAELNYVDGVTSAIQTQLDSKITTAAVVAGYQPLDSDLTAVAALTTDAYGRGFLILASDADLATKIAAMAPTWSAVHTFVRSSGYPTIDVRPASESVSSGIQISNAAGSRKLEILYTGTGGGGVYGLAAGTVGINGIAGLALCANDAVALDIDTAKKVRVFSSTVNAMREVGLRSLPYVGFTSNSTLTAANNGQLVYHSSGAGVTLTLGALDDETIITLANLDSNSFTIAPGSGTLYWANGTTLATGNRTLNYGGVVTAHRIAGNWFLLGGVGVS